MVNYITKIIEHKESYLKELNFYSSIRSLGMLSTISPRLILNSEFNGIFLITLEYINSLSHEKTIPINSLLKSLKIVSTINTEKYIQITKDKFIERPLYLDNNYNFKRIIYKNLITIFEAGNLNKKT